MSVTIYNIRGTNGSGKSTLARAFIHGDPAAEPNHPEQPTSPTMVDLARYPAPTTRDVGRTKFVEGYASPGKELDVLVVGSYRTACGGLDGVPDFKTSFAAVRRAAELVAQHGKAPHGAVIAEGVLASTVWKSWREFAGMSYWSDICAQVAFCYLDTPLEVCLERIRKRQEAAGKVRKINEQQVADKVKAIAATRLKAINDGQTVYDLPWQNAEEVLRAVMVDGPLRIMDEIDTTRRARDFYRAR